jgi:Cu(I)/Ag(I) efflux system membrane fusion protein
VNLGQVTNEFAQILDGVEMGDQVVTSAQYLLDSDSSINSDFMRMSFIQVDDDQVNTTDKNQPDSAIVEGVINLFNLRTRVANISRGPIEKWQRGPATLDFVFSNGVSLNQLQQGDKIYFTFEIQNGDFVITDYAVIKHADDQEHDQEQNND